jgi:hypothetical protein
MCGCFKILTNTRRRLRFVLLAGLVLAVGVWWWTARQTLWAHHVDRVSIGMTLEQVIAVLGRPPDTDSIMFSSGSSGRKPELWLTIDGVIVVTFENDQVIDYNSGSMNPIECQYQRLRARFGF